MNRIQEASNITQQRGNPWIKPGTPWRKPVPYPPPPLPPVEPRGGESCQQGSGQTERIVKFPEWSVPHKGGPSVRDVHSTTDGSLTCIAHWAQSGLRPRMPSIENPSDMQEVRKPIDEELIIYTDGACFRNGSEDAVASIGVWFGPEHDLNLSKIVPLDQQQTNNIAEIYAAVEAVRQARVVGARRICIRSDSDLLVKAWNKMVPYWQINEWKTAAGKPVRHKGYYLTLIEEIAQTPGAKLRMEYVPGHRDDYGNIGADALASMAIKRYIGQINERLSLFDPRAPKVEYQKSIFGGNPTTTPLDMEKMRKIEESCEKINKRMEQVERQERDEELRNFSSNVSADYIKARDYVRKLTASHNIPVAQFNDLVREVFLDARESRRRNEDSASRKHPSSSRNEDISSQPKKPRIASEVHVRSYTPPLPPPRK